MGLVYIIDVGMVYVISLAMAVIAYTESKKICNKPFKIVNIVQLVTYGLIAGIFLFSIIFPQYSIIAYIIDLIK